VDFFNTLGGIISLNINSGLSSSSGVSVVDVYIIFVVIDIDGDIYNILRINFGKISNIVGGEDQSVSIEFGLQSFFSQS